MIVIMFIVGIYEDLMKYRLTSDVRFIRNIFNFKPSWRFGVRIIMRTRSSFLFTDLSPPLLLHSPRPVVRYSSRRKFSNLFANFFFERYNDRTRRNLRVIFFSPLSFFFFLFFFYFFFRSLLSLTSYLPTTKLPVDSQMLTSNQGKMIRRRQRIIVRTCVAFNKVEIPILSYGKKYVPSG